VQYPQRSPHLPPTWTASSLNSSAASFQLRILKSVIGSGLRFRALLSAGRAPRLEVGAFSEVHLTSISAKYLEETVFGLQPTLLSFIIFCIKVIEKVRNIRDTLHLQYTTQRRTGAKVAL
jgi:hypothetical protein